MLFHCKPLLLAGCDQVAEPFFLPAVVRSAGLLSFGRMQRSNGGKLAPRLPETIILRRDETIRAMVRVILIVASTASGIGVVCADQSPLGVHNVSQATADSIAQFVAAASKRFTISEPLIRAVLRVESAGNPRARSPKGAIGLMQIMPTTWTELQGRYGLGADPYDPHDNIMAGAAYLRELHDRFGEPGFLAAYNAGPGRYEEHLATGRPLPDERQNYVAAVMRSVDGIQIGRLPTVGARPTLPNDSPLFVARKATTMMSVVPANVVRSGRSTNARVADLSALIPRSNRLFARRVDGRGSQ